MARGTEGTRDGDLDRILRETFTSDFRTGYISIEGFCLPEYYNIFADAIKNFKVRDDDIWVCSFPSTGTTWTQEMVWCIANNLDFDGAKTDIYTRFPFFDMSILCDFSAMLSHNPRLNFPDAVFDSVSFIDKLSSPRFIKSHLPFDLLPREIREGTRKPKIIYVTRNVKDTCISYFHHCQLLEGYRGNFDDFCKLFLAGKLSYAPFWKHVLGFWSRRNNENFLFLKYEDMKADLASVIRRTGAFLGKSSEGGWISNDTMTDTNIEKLMIHLSFKNMKSNAAVNHGSMTENTKKLYQLPGIQGTFMRKGEINQWKKDMTSEVCEKFDKLTREHFGDTDLDLA